MVSLGSYYSISELANAAENEFHARYSRSPEFIVAAPGRVNLIGEHVDYNDGLCLPMAIERYVVIAAAPNDGSDGPFAEFYSSNLQEAVIVSLQATHRSGSNGWCRYLEGIVRGFMARGVAIPSFDAIIYSNVPLGGGLSSSAALEVATATVLELLTQTDLEPVEKALLCQAAEQEIVGVPCGIMDQFSSVFGKPDELMLLDCRAQKIQAIPFPIEEITILIVNSNVAHELSSGEYAKRRAQCQSVLEKLQQSSWRDVTMDCLGSCSEMLSATEYRRARHVVTEIARTVEAAKAAESGKWERVGELMYASHESLRDDFNVSCDELDILVELAREAGVEGGVLGSRMTGGGFGGCTVSIVESEKAEKLIESLVFKYEQITGIKPDGFTSRPAQGAHVIKE